MKPKLRWPTVTFYSVLWGSFLAGPAAQARPQTKHASGPQAVKAADELPIPALPPSARVVAYGEQDVVPVSTKLRYTTLIVLPKNEEILDFTCGDKEFWVVNGNLNFAYVKPAKAGAKTNLNLVTASGNIYSFMLSEVSESPKGEPDLKLFVELKDNVMLAATRSGPKFVSAEELQR